MSKIDFTNTNDDSALADGKTPINVEVTYTDETKLLSGKSLKFTLSDVINATFSDNTTITYKTTDVLGKATVSFTSNKSGNGVLLVADADDKSINNHTDYNFIPDFSIKFDDLTNNYAIADETQKIKAVVTLLNNNTVYVNTNTYGRVLTLELVSDKAHFVDENGNDKSSIIENASFIEGKCTVYFVDSLAEGGLITAALKSPDDPTDPATDQRAFSFSTPDPDQITLTLDNSNPVMGATIVAKALITNEKQKPLENKSVEFSLISNLGNAYLDPADTTPTKNSIKTDSSGIASINIKDPTWGAGTITATIVKANTVPLHSSKPFDFAVSGSIHLGNINFTVYQADGENERVTFNQYPACSDTNVIGTSPAANIILYNGASPVGKNFPVYFWFSGDNSDNISLKSDVKYDKEMKVYISETDGDGLVNVSFLSNVPDTYTINFRLNTGNEALDKVVSADFKFVDPWASVTNVKLLFSNSTNNANIFNNGINQARLCISMDLIDEKAETLCKNNIPNDIIRNIENYVKVIDYVTGNEVSTSENTSWSYSLISNVYEKEFNQNNQIYEYDNIIIDDDQTYINNINSNGRLQIYYYLTYNNKSLTNSLRLGLKIFPSGKMIAKSSTGNVGKLASYDPIYLDSSSSDAHNSMNSTINAIRTKQYDADAFDMKLVNLATTGIDEHAEDFSKDNCYRYAHYKISLNKQNYNYTTYIQKYTIIFDPTTNKESYLTDYSFAECNSGLYNCKTYLWPNTLYDESGNKIVDNTSSQYQLSMNAGLYPNRSVNIKTEDDSLYVTVFWEFGTFNHGYKKDMCLNIVATDCYGNTGEFYISTNNTYNVYDSDKAANMSTNSFLSNISKVSTLNPASNIITFTLDTYNQDSDIDNNRRSLNTDNTNGLNKIYGGELTYLKSLPAILEWHHSDPDVYYPRGEMIISNLSKQDCGLFISYNDANQKDMLYLTKDSSIFLFRPVWKNNTVVITLSDNTNTLSITSNKVTETHTQTPENLNYVRNYTYAGPIGSEYFEWHLIPYS